MAKFTHLMAHCFDTPRGKWYDRQDLEKWHLKERGWSRVGYSAIFLLDGTTDIIIPFDNDDQIESWEISNGARGWNGCTRHFAYVGGANNQDTRTAEQRAAMEAYVKLHVMLFPSIKLIGHNQVSTKTCPSYSVVGWAKSIGISDKNIDFKHYK
jgi:N-acetylmuramoyl-L-alanine amidase